MMMKAMILHSQGQPLAFSEMDVPEPKAGQALLRVGACAVCRTDLHILDGDLKEPKLPLVLGHEIVARVEALGEGAQGLERGQRVGVPWLGWCCGKCRFCQDGRENLCGRARFTGYHLDGGYAQYTSAEARFCLPLPEGNADQQAAPLLCAGLIGYRCLLMAGDARRLGLYGFGAAAHIIAQLATYQGREIYAFTRPGDLQAQEFASGLGADWAGGSDQLPPQELDAAIIFAPLGELVPAALKAVRRGGTVVCGGIHMSDIPRFPYELLWGERILCSVANLTRRDGLEFLKIAPQAGIRTETVPYPLEQANQALQDLRQGRLQGAAVLDLTMG